MNTTSTLILASLLVVACDARTDTHDEPVPRNGETGTTSDLPPPEPPMPTSACRCDPDKKDTCPLGTDCVPYLDADDKSSWFCMAPCTGYKNELGGTNVTSCTNSDGSPAFCKYPEGFPTPYCPKCVACEERPQTLFCE